jgi:hypothetical protein
MLPTSSQQRRVRRAPVNSRLSQLTISTGPRQPHRECNIHWFDQTATPGVTPTTGEVVVEIYRVFPALSDVNRTSGPPTFSTSQVPTRVNSPSDVEHDGRATSSGDLTFTTKVPGNTFTALNSVQPNGIHPTPNQTTSGNGPVTGQEVEFYVNFSKSFDFSPDHYFLCHKYK